MAALAWLTEQYTAVVESGRSRLVVHSQPWEALPLLALWPKSGTAIFWQKADLTLLGGGCAYECVAAGRDRFSALKQHWQALAGEWVGDLAPRAFVAFSFFDTVAETALFPAACLHLPLWLVQQQGDQTYLQRYAYLTPDSDLARISREWQEAEQRLVTPPPLNNLANSEPIAMPRLSGTNYREAVRAGLTAIHSGELSKVVIAHAITLSSAQPWHIGATLQQLQQLYPDCTCFGWQNSQAQAFLGASPESLVTVHNGWLRTEAVAGSTPRGTTPEQDQQLAATLLSSEKEGREHEVVVTTLREQLHHLGLAVPAPLPPQVRQLSTIQHLHTTLSAASTLHILDVIAALHPTPAVAGAPAEAACRYIAQTESFERGLYAAPLGWLDRQGNGDSVVAIRSALLNGQSAHLYAGAGVVAGSDPDREWAEVLLKLQVLLKALR